MVANYSILPGKIIKINPENSDFSVGNFLTKKAESQSVM